MPAKKVAKKKAAKTAVKKAAPKAAKKVSKVKESFELHAPDAEHVLLAGDFTGWEDAAKPMKRLKSGVWR